MPTIRERVGRWLLPATETTTESAEAEESFDPTFTGGIDGVGDTVLAIDDIGWMPTNLQSFLPGGDLRPLDRRATVRRARIYYNKDAMSHRAVRLHTIYCVGRGFSIKARDYSEDTADDASVKALQADADAFWEHPDNTYVFSTEAQSVNSDRLNTDGELFFTLWPPQPDASDLGDDPAEDDTDADNVTRVRTLPDCLEVTRIIFNPEDMSEPWYYLRVWQQGNQQRQMLYPDYRLFLRDARDDAGDLRLPPVPVALYPELGSVPVQTTAFIYHAKVNTIGTRGNSVLGPAMDWSKINRQFLEDRATISRAHARFAWKRIIKGPASAVAAFGRRAASAVGITGKPVPAPSGATLNVNQGVDWEAMNSQDGGKNAEVESRNFRLMFFAAVGFAEHYFGDGSNGTRATSKSMERPTELMLQAYQTILKGAYEALFSFHLAATGRTYDAHAVWVDAPQILEDDTNLVISAILEVMAVMPQFNIDEIIIRMLNALGIDDPQDVIVKIREKEQEVYSASLQIAAVQAGLDLDATVDPNDPTAMAKQNNSLKTLLTMITNPGDATKLPGPKIGPQFGVGQPGASLRVRKPAPAKAKPTDSAAA